MSPTFASVARMVGDPQLEEALAALATSVKTEVHNAEFMDGEGHKRSDFRADFERLKKEAARFEKAPNQASKQLLALPFCEIERLSAAKQAIHDIKALCDKALSINPAKRGRTEIPGRLTCALIVIEAWARAHNGRTPGHNNVEAQ